MGSHLNLPAAPVEEGLEPRKEMGFKQKGDAEDLKETAEEMNGNAQRKWEMGAHLDLPALGSWVWMEG